MEVRRHVQNTQDKKLVKRLQYIVINISTSILYKSQLLLCSILIQDI